MNPPSPLSPSPHYSITPMVLFPIYTIYITIIVIKIYIYI